MPIVFLSFFLFKASLDPAVARMLREQNTYGHKANTCQTTLPLTTQRAVTSNSRNTHLGQDALIMPCQPGPNCGRDANTMPCQQAHTRPGRTGCRCITCHASQDTAMARKRHTQSRASQDTSVARMSMPCHASQGTAMARMNTTPCQASQDTAMARMDTRTISMISSPGDASLTTAMARKGHGF